MNTEEKAQAYDEALERARKQKYDYQKELDKTDKSSQLAGILRAGISAIELAFPELRESEDERIREDLIGGLMWQRDNLKCNGQHDNSNILPGFCFSVGEHLAYLEKQKEQKPAEWSEEDEKMMNLTKTQLRILQSHLSHAHSKSMSDMEYSSRLLQIEKCVSWLDIRLKSLHPQPKQEWSENDKAIVNCIACCLDGSFVPEAARKQSLIWFNKHRRDFLNRPSWKPSEEQLEAV